MLPAVSLHAGARAESLAAARIYVFSIWVGYLALDAFTRLSYLPPELFQPFGVLRLFPAAVWPGLTSALGLLLIKSAALICVLAALAGWRSGPGFAFLAFWALFLMLGVEKGFGGHFDHRELTLLYITGTLALLPAWDAWSLRRADASRRREGIYSASLIVLCGIIAVQYVFIGSARVFMGGPEVFWGGLQTWIQDRALRPNPYGFDLGRYLLEGDLIRVGLDALLVISTAMEIAIPIAFFLRGTWAKAVFLGFYAGFHAGILLLMNVAFPENALLLLLFFDLSVPVRRVLERHASPGIVLFDGDCSLCNGFVRFLYFADGRERLRFSPLRGSTAKALGVVAADLPPGSPPESVIFYDESSKTLHQRSAAAAEILYRLPSYAWLGWLLSLVPRVLRDAGYVTVARSRYALFGTVDTCYLGEKPDDRRFLP